MAAEYCSEATCGGCGRCDAGSEPHANEVCTKCGADFYMDHRQDVGQLCDRCCNERDAIREEFRRAYVRKFYTETDVA